ncbi:MAG: MATE family efflux transporter [Bacteriovoracaceae bacterium]
MKKEIESSPKSYKEILLFSLPSIFTTLIEPLSGVVDTALIGHKEPHVLGALGIGAMIVSSCAWIFNFLVHVPTQKFSGLIAEKNWQRLNKSFSSATFLALVLGPFITIVLFLFHESLLKISNTPIALFNETKDYLLMRALAIPMSLFFTVHLSLQRGMKKVKLALISFALVTVLNVFLSWLFVYVFELSITGVAYGTLLSYVLGSVGVAIWRKVATTVKLELTNVLKEKGELLSIGKDGFNMFVRTAFLTFSFYLMTRSAASLGADELAAFHIGLQVWLLSSYFIDGLAMTATILVADALVLKNYSYLKLIFKRLFIVTLATSSVLGLVYYFGRQELVLVFSRDVKFGDLLVWSWPILSLSQVFLGPSYLMDGFLFGAGAFSYLKKHMAIGFFLTIVPIQIYGTINGFNLSLLWIGLSLLGLYRFCSGWFFWQGLSRDFKYEV